MLLKMGMESSSRSDFLLAGVGFRFLMPVDAPMDLLGFFLPRLGGLSSASLSGTVVFVTSDANFLFFDGLELRWSTSPSLSGGCASTVTLILHGLVVAGASMVMDFEGDARRLAAPSSISSFLIDLGLFDTGVLLLERIGVVNFGNVLEDRVSGSGDDSELPPTHSSTTGVAVIAITSIVSTMILSCSYLCRVRGWFCYWFERIERGRCWMTRSESA
jgi:hypothetical protein